MLRVLRTRIQQGHRTMAWPDGPPPALPERFAGRPTVAANCASGCDACKGVCPTGAIFFDASDPSPPCIDTGKCLFCRRCEQACPGGRLKFTGEHRLAAARREDLVVRAGGPDHAPALVEKAKALFGRSLKLRQVSAGGCNACEADANVLGTLAWDMGRFGIQFVASPRHADGLLITGPVSENMRLGLLKTYEATPAPKIVIAVGACAVSGGPYAGHAECRDGVASIVPVDVFIPGCPPHPLTILDGLLRAIGHVE